jgi:hypothetical protein
MKEKYPTREKCQEREGTLDIPEEHSIFAPVIGVDITKK